jgi:hypothetical protein
MKKILRCAFIALGLWCVYQFSCYAWWYLMAWSGSAPYDNMVERVEGMPTEKVVEKLHSFDLFSPYPWIATKILAERRDVNAVPALIDVLKSWSQYKRRNAIWALSLINDPRATEPLMKIVLKGERHPNYLDALSALSKMKYEDAYKYVLERAHRENAYLNGSVGMLAHYGKPESIQLLIEMKSRIKDSDPLAKMGRKDIDNAIENIEGLNYYQKSENEQ